MATNAERKEYIEALHGVEFPASRSQIVNKAKDKGGLDTEVIAVLEELPDRTYNDAADLRREVQQVYERTGETTETLDPAAPSPFTDKEKDLIKSMADPRREGVEQE